MSLLGYNLKDIYQMQNALVDVIHQTHEKETQEGLDMLYDFLEGLIEEGRI